eukprot:CAMPEP_0198251474 /NCGR_PEP_ID=MMETSP1447-20131203/2301_1 /TAXON_ID=420782 /ORGANISM="Chaetoceros dichaeta, Strain CCMP1751" /LENGTH=359 /DNA_ID=CAMNT_0043936511 /DNA_START=319 /DNA_END=1398 /DNA_ORIENTATION=+
MTAKDAIQRVANALYISGNMFFVALFIQLPLQASAAWGSSGGSSAVFGMSQQRDWYDSSVSSSMSLKYEGCVWSYAGGEDMGCMDDESEDGTSNWYMMANCRRAQVAYSVYASSGTTTSCNNGNFKESLVTKSGVAEFASTMGSYSNSDTSPVTAGDVCDWPMCEVDNDGYYLSIGCSTSGDFTIDRFVDEYCLQYYDNYDTLSNFNTKMKSNNLNSCFTAYSSTYDSSPDTSLLAYLLADSSTCSATESSYCTTSDFVAGAGSTGGFQHNTNKFKSSGDMVLANRLKYAFGGSLLLGSVIMFFGILFTNRRKRRALMHRKFRNGPSARSKSKKSGGSTKSKRKKKKEGSHGRNSGILA